MFAILTALTTLCVIAVVESRVLMVQDSPITSEGLTLRISLKEDASGQKVASIKLLMEDEPKAPPMKYTPHLLGELIPDVQTRFGIKDGKCPLDYVRRGSLCTPK